MSGGVTMGGVLGNRVRPIADGLGDAETRDGADRHIADRTNGSGRPIGLVDHPR